jgi:hypothetical protein
MKGELTMKKQLFSIVILIFMALISFNASAIIVGYSAHLEFVHERTGVRMVSNPAGESESACERNRSDTIASMASSGFVLDESRSTPCRPHDEKLPPLDDVTAIKVLPPGPQCLSCPLLNEKTIGIFYPEFPNKVLQLYYQYNIESYNAELRNLQSKYKLEGFTQQLYFLNQQQK